MFNSMANSFPFLFGLEEFAKTALLLYLEYSSNNFTSYQSFVKDLTTLLLLTVIQSC